MYHFAKRQRNDSETGEFCWNLPGRGVACRDDPPPHPLDGGRQSSRVSGMLRQIEWLAFVEAALPAVAKRQGGPINRAPLPLDMDPLPLDIDPLSLRGAQRVDGGLGQGRADRFLPRELGHSLAGQLVGIRNGFRMRQRRRPPPCSLRRGPTPASVEQVQMPFVSAGWSSTHGAAPRRARDLLPTRLQNADSLSVALMA
jgi:hypothetical protein